MIKQMKLSNFCKEYDMSRTTVLDLIYYQICRDIKSEDVGILT